MGAIYLAKNTIPKRVLLHTPNIFSGKVPTQILTINLSLVETYYR